MAKYDELCTLYRAAASRLQEYETSCSTFIENFFAGLTDFLQSPENALQFHLLTDPLNIETALPLAKAINHSPDGFYDVIFSLNIHSGDENDRILAAARFKKMKEYFIIRIGMSRKEFQIQEPNTQKDVYEYIFTAIKDYYQKDGFIKSLPATIGFTI
ncbi:MAG: hypothetical protein ABFC84_16070 [Veillonellales bacterium]